jgi:hypothetical protein
VSSACASQLGACMCAGTAAPACRGTWPHRALWQAAAARLGAVYGTTGVRRHLIHVCVHSRQSYAGIAHAPHVAGATVRRSGAQPWRRRWHNSNCDPVFKIIKLQEVSTYLKIFKNKSCRGAIDLQLSQRASYVLINRFVAKTR